MSSAGVLRIAYSSSATILQRELVLRTHLTRCYSTRPNGTVKNNRSYLFGKIHRYRYKVQICLRATTHILVPGSEAHKIEKSLTISSSVIIYDLESSVDPAKKSHAREYLRYFLTEVCSQFTDERINEITHACVHYSHGTETILSQGQV